MRLARPCPTRSSAEKKPLRTASVQRRCRASGSCPLLQPVKPKPEGGEAPSGRRVHLTYVKGRYGQVAILMRGLQSVRDLSMSTNSPAISGDALPGLFASAFEFLVDTGQRSVLFLDVMRQRGMQYREHLAETAPHVLNYAVELIIDGRKLERPVNYGLVRVAPPSGVKIDIRRRPFVVVDPRAGHGPGIGGFKADSEIGVAMAAGHPW